jgi:predicted secreted protein
MKFTVLLAATVAFAVSAPALADEKDSGAAQETPKEKKICRTETVTGSIIAKRRTCLTKAQWDQLEEANRASVDRYTSRQSGRPGGQTNPAAPTG